MKLKKLLVGLIATTMLFNFTACTYEDKIVYFDTPSGSNTIFKISTMKCQKDEALIYLVNAKNIYGNVEGVGLWNGDFNTSVIIDSLKDSVMEHLTRVYVLDLYAQEQEIELTEAEEAKCQEAGAEYFNSLSDAEKAFFDTSEKNIVAMYKRYALAEKIYSELMNSVDEEVSEDEARVMEAYVLYVTSNPEEMQAKIDADYSFETIASTYTELDTYQVTFARNEYPLNVDEVVFNLDTGEISEAIEADGGYYFFQCLDKYNEELSEANKDVIIQSRRQQVLADIVEQQQELYYSDMHEALWEAIDIPNDLAADLLTDSFFSVLADHISFE